MRQHCCHPEQLSGAAPATSLRSLHPNHTWQVDASVCVLYRMRGSQSVRLLNERDYNEHKPGKLVEISGQRILRYLVIDHYSGNIYLHYEQAKGEDVQRCDVIDLPPIKDSEAYLAFRFKVAGADITSIFEPDALALLREQLVVASSLNSNGVYLGYPLAIANLARAAMSKAYEIGESIVTGDVMRLVQPKEAGRV